LIWAEEAIPTPLPCGLLGTYQQNNIRCVQAALAAQTHWTVSNDALRTGLLEVVQRTGLRGRWEILQESGPRVVADTGHNAHGLQWVVQQLQDELPAGGRLLVVLGTVSDKDPGEVLALFPADASYFWVAANLPRALSAATLAERAAEYALRGRVSGPVGRGFADALAEAGPHDLVFVGGSNFVVAEALTFWEQR
jgi:dihydrofolate synthase/folylpolyglutamate synthase